MRLVDPQMLHKRQARLGEPFRRHRPVDVAAVARARIVEGDHPVTVLERRDLRQPGAVVSGQPVDQHQREALAFLDVVERKSARIDFRHNRLPVCQRPGILNWGPPCGLSQRFEPCPKIVREASHWPYGRGDVDLFVDDLGPLIASMRPRR